MLIRQLVSPRVDLIVDCVCVCVCVLMVYPSAFSWLNYVGQCVELGTKGMFLFEPNDNLPISIKSLRVGPFKIVCMCV